MFMFSSTLLIVRNGIVAVVLAFWSTHSVCTTWVCFYCLIPTPTTTHNRSYFTALCIASNWVLCFWMLAVLAGGLVLAGSWVASDQFSLSRLAFKNCWGRSRADWSRDNSASLLKWSSSADSILFPLYQEGLSAPRGGTWTIPSPLWATEVTGLTAFQWFFPHPVEFCPTSEQKQYLAKGSRGLLCSCPELFLPVKKAPHLSGPPSQAPAASTAISGSSTQWDHRAVWFLISVTVPGNCLQAVRCGRVLGSSTFLLLGTTALSCRLSNAANSYLMYFGQCCGCLQRGEGREGTSVAVNSPWVETELCLAYIQEILRRLWGTEISAPEVMTTLNLSNSSSWIITRRVTLNISITTVVI